MERGRGGLSPSPSPFIDYQGGSRGKMSRRGNVERQKEERKRGVEGRERKRGGEKERERRKRKKAKWLGEGRDEQRRRTR